MSNEIKEIKKNRKNAGFDYLIIKLDHITYRVKRDERMVLIGELMNILPYHKFKNFKVIHSNAITTCIKLHDTLPVVVISEGTTDDSIVEEYCQKFGSRIHHLAYLVKDTEKIVEIQKKPRIKFTTDHVIGNEEEGIKQIFTKPTSTSNHTIEYIQWFGGFDGFFTPANNSEIMESRGNLFEV
jgi:hypothetical protein